MMALRVAVVDPLPIFRQGAVRLLTDAGYEVAEPADVVAWARGMPRTVVLLTLADERSWEVLRQLAAEAPDQAVIALVDRLSTPLGATAVRSGARSVIPREATAAVLIRSVEATADGQAVMPAAVASALVVGLPADQSEGWSPPEEQVSWLRQLAAGSTVVGLARQAGYSERAMYRLLSTLYQRMGVSTRTEAIMRAHELGWLAAIPAARG